MFPRRKRLSREAFPAVLKTGRRLSSANMSIVLPENASGYAVVVPKKVARLSTTRHRIKRRILAALSKLKLPPALIVFPRASINSVEYRDIETELAILLSKIHTKPNAPL